MLQNFILWDEIEANEVETLKIKGVFQLSPLNIKQI